MIRAELTGVEAAITALEGVSVDAARARQTAWRAVRRGAQGSARRALAGRWAVPMKVFARRCAVYQRKSRPAYLRLWLGLLRRPRRGEHRMVAKAIDALGDARLKYLPIERGAESILRKAAFAAMRERYGPTLSRDYSRRVRKRLAGGKRKGRR